MKCNQKVRRYLQASLMSALEERNSGLGDFQSPWGRYPVERVFGIKRNMRRITVVVSAIAAKGE